MTLHQSLAQKIISKHANKDVVPNELVIAHVDVAAVQDGSQALIISEI